MKSFAPLSRSILFCALAAIALLAMGCSSPVRIEWSTETELNTAGFNLYRSESPEGPFELKVNEGLIPAAPDPLLGGEYSFVDRGARPGVLYYYLLEEVELSGAKSTHGPISADPGQAGWMQRLLLGGLALLAVILWFLGARMHKEREGHLDQA